MHICGQIRVVNDLLDISSHNSKHKTPISFLPTILPHGALFVPATYTIVMPTMAHSKSGDRWAK